MPRARHSIDPQAIGDIIENRLGKRVGLLKHHAHAPPQVDDIQREDVLAIQQHFAFEARLRNRFIHPVQNPQEGGLAAAGRADQRGDASGGNLQVMECSACFPP